MFGRVYFRMFLSGIADSDIPLTPLRTQMARSIIKHGPRKQKCIKEAVARDGFEPSIYGL
jgi:hypothetical protein